MKFDGYRFVIDWTWLYFIPSIVLTVNEPMYCYHNFNIRHQLLQVFLSEESVEWLEEDIDEAHT